MKPSVLFQMMFFSVLLIFYQISFSNAAFSISINPDVAVIVETQTVDVFLASIGVASGSNVGSLRCQIDRTRINSFGGQTNPSSSNPTPFTVGNVGSNNNFGFLGNNIIFRVDSPFKLDSSSVASYELFPLCTDNSDSTNTQINTAQSITIFVLDNSRPSFRTPIASVDVNVGLNASAVTGATVYNVSANVLNDQSSDVLTYQLVASQPKVDYFDLNTATGILTNKVDLRTATQSPIELTIQVNDGFNNALRSLSLTVNLLNMNQRPDIVGLPLTISRDENTNTFTIVDITVTDDSGATNLIPSCTVLPTGGQEVFDLVTRPISLKPRGTQFGTTFLDFETTPKYTVTCSVSDGFLTSEGEVLTLNVNNVNEPPVFSKTLINCIMDESKAGESVCNLDFTIRDPEGNQFVTRLLQDQNTNRFALTSTTNNLNGNNGNFFSESDRLTFNTDYDVDNGNMPEKVTLFVQAVDEFGAVGTSTVSVTVRDVNDNAPEFNLLNTAVELDYSTPTGLLGKIQATDDDSGTNGEIDYRLVQVVPPNAINFVAVLGNGDIQYIRQYPDSLAGSSVYLSVEAKDKGNPALSSTGTVVVSLVATTTTSTTTTTTTTPATTTVPTTTTPEPGFFDSQENVAVFSILMVLLLLALLAALYFLFRWCITGTCCGGGGGSGGGGMCDCCQPPPPRRVTPVIYEDFDMPPVTASDYKGDFWRQGDYYESGRPF